MNNNIVTKPNIWKRLFAGFIDYFIIFINFIAVPYLLYNVIKSFDDRNFFSTNRTIILINFTIVIAVSIYTSIKLSIYIKRIKMQLTTVDNAIQHFSTDSEVLKAEYETYVNEYLKSNNFS